MFSVDLLSKSVPIDVVSKLLGHTSIKTTEKQYAPWVRSRQMKLEEAVRATWASVL
jgi:integrase